MIRIEFTVDSKVINAAVMEEIKDRIRRDIVPMVFKAVDGVADDRGYRFSHRDVAVDGSIKVQA
jgi:hypothetical protein